MMRIWKGLQFVAISHWSNGFSANEEYWNISLKADVYLSLIGRQKEAEFYHYIDRRRYLVWLKWFFFIVFSGQLMVSLKYLKIVSWGDIDIMIQSGGERKTFRKSWRQQHLKRTKSWMNGKNKVDLNTVNERGQYLGGKWG